jgi:transcriptional regulator with XRE-family HTH domain
MLISLGDHIRARRLELGMLQREVAEALGVDTMTITNWERNQYRPSPRMLPRLFRFLGDSPSPTELT